MCRDNPNQQEPCVVLRLLFDFCHIHYTGDRICSVDIEPGMKRCGTQLYPTHMDLAMGKIFVDGTTSVCGHINAAQLT